VTSSAKIDRRWRTSILPWILPPNFKISFFFPVFVALFLIAGCPIYVSNTFVNYTAARGHNLRSLVLCRMERKLRINFIGGDDNVRRLYVSPVFVVIKGRSELLIPSSFFFLSLNSLLSASWQLLPIVPMYSPIIYAMYMHVHISIHFYPASRVALCSNQMTCIICIWRQRNIIQKSRDAPWFRIVLSVQPTCLEVRSNLNNILGDASTSRRRSVRVCLQI
jgi:hypothetical protein